ncbi:MAG: hypothetical protein ACRDQB_12315, partial [Thermocrispum sp.]
MAKGFTTELESLAETVPVLQSMSMDLQVMSQSLVGSNIIVGPIYTHLEAALGRYSDCRDTLARQVGQGEAAIAA